MILLDALTFFLILWLNPQYLSEYLHLPFLLTHVTFLPQYPGSQWISIVQALNHIKLVFFFIKCDEVVYKSRGVRSQRAKVARNGKSRGVGGDLFSDKSRYWYLLSIFAPSILTNKPILFF